MARSTTPNVLTFPDRKTPGPKKGTGKPVNLRSAAARRAVEYGQQPRMVLGRGMALIYRPSRTAGPGSWAVKAADADGTYVTTIIGTADDRTQANGQAVLSCEQAIARAIEEGTKIREGGGASAVGAGITVRESIDRYVEQLAPRGRRAAREARATLNKHLEPLMSRTVRSLRADDMMALRDTVPERTRSSFKAALNGLPPGIRPGLDITRSLNGPGTGRTVPDDETRTIGIDKVLSLKQVQALVRQARNHDDAFGRFVAVLAATGCRPGQVAKCRVRDLEGDLLVVPPSRKGRPGKAKPWSRRPLPADLAAELRAASEGREPNTLLFPIPAYERDVTSIADGGSGWRLVGEQPWHSVAWGRAAADAGISGGLYQLRHSCIVRLLLAHVPIRLVAATLDTSVSMLENTYSRWIAPHGEDVMAAEVARLRL